jgi:hypothetical protein
LKHSKGITGLRMSDEGRALLEKLAKHYRISMAAVVEVAITDLAAKVGILDTPVRERMIVDETDDHGLT